MLQPYFPLTPLRGTDATCSPATYGGGTGSIAVATTQVLRVGIEHYAGGRGEPVGAGRARRIGQGRDDRVAGGLSPTASSLNAEASCTVTSPGSKWE